MYTSFLWALISFDSALYAFRCAPLNECLSLLFASMKKHCVPVSVHVYFISAGSSFSSKKGRENSKTHEYIVPMRFFLLRPHSILDWIFMRFDICLNVDNHFYFRSIKINENRFVYFADFIWCECIVYTCISLNFCSLSFIIIATIRIPSEWYTHTCIPEKRSRSSLM